MEALRRLAAAAVLLAASPGHTASTVDVSAFVKKDIFDDIKLSPGGDYYAATVRGEDRTTLVVLRRSDGKITANVGAGKNTVVDDFWWVNPQRIVASIAEKFGSLDQPSPTGELYAINADGSQRDILVGWRVEGNGLGTRIQPKKVEAVWAELVDDLPRDDKNVVVSVGDFSDEPYTRAELMDVYTGRRVQVARAPVRRATFYTDNQGEVRFAHGAGADNSPKLYYRNGRGEDWQLVNDQGRTGLDERVIGFSADDGKAYLQAEQKAGPDAIVELNLADMSHRQVMRDDAGDPARIIYRNGTRVPVGVLVMDGKPRSVFFDQDAPEARLYRSLEASFADSAVRPTSHTADGRLSLVQVYSDRNPGDFYLFDAVAKNAEHAISLREWFDPDRMASMRPVVFKARDGLELHGYLTIPSGSEAKGLPLVVMPHGGPFGVKDVWGFGTDEQMLAQAGYGVLQLNFRGSGGYGRAFRQAGAKQWGKAMQDDLTDATRWAIQQGIADPARICIYGASYGGYAALMGVAKEPDLYRCAVGYVGIYDLPTLYVLGDIQDRRSGANYLKDWVGAPEELASVSPTRMADRIKAPVFLAAGGEDQRAPLQHSEKMEQALRKAGVAVETLYYKTEGHGFYKEEHQREFQTRLLDFLARHLGGKPASAGAATSTLK